MLDPNATRTILIVDDDPLNIKVINEILLEKNFGQFEILNANNGKLAFKIAQSMLPDVIISDWEMPEMNGIELIEVLKEEESTREIPIIIATGVMLTSMDLRMALSAGAVDYVRKPIDRIELRARIRSALEMADFIKEIKEKRTIIAEQKNEILKHSINQLENELTYKQRELAANIGFLIQIENEKESHANELNKLKPYLNGEGKKQLQEILEQLKQENNNNTLLGLEVRFDEINHRFYQALEQKDSSITKNEKMLCAYMRMNLSPSEIAVITQKNLNSINVSFSRLRSKLNIESNTELKALLEKIGDT